MIRRPPRSTLFPTRRSSDLFHAHVAVNLVISGSLKWIAIELHVLLDLGDRKSTRLNSSHLVISYAVFCLKKKKNLHYRIHLTDFVSYPNSKAFTSLPSLSGP